MSAISFLFTLVASAAVAHAVAVTMHPLSGGCSGASAGTLAIAEGACWNVYGASDCVNATASGCSSC